MCKGLVGRRIGFGLKAPENYSTPNTAYIVQWKSFRYWDVIEITFSLFTRHSGPMETASFVQSRSVRGVGRPNHGVKLYYVGEKIVFVRPTRNVSRYTCGTVHANRISCSPSRGGTPNQWVGEPNSRLSSRR